MNLIDSLKGSKTYLLGLAAIAYAVGGYFSGNMPEANAIATAWLGLVAMALRAGVSNSLLDIINRYFITPLETPPVPPITPATPITLTLSQDQLAQLQAGAALELRVA